ncbi:MAG: radical SAM protein [Deltaproteobacteria bacterium]|nr:radical SAM protein [Deltaproteobacteria bacterium]
METTEKYKGFEQGPIRPPSEASSLLIRVTRNCPWNKCIFCPVYKKRKFSIRPVEHVIKDIDSIKKHLEAIFDIAGEDKNINRTELQNYINSLSNNQMPALNAAWHWFISGMKSIFIQDANSLIIKPQDFIRILSHIKESFPFLKRITSYARSHTVARISDQDMKELVKAGLNRIHIGLESGSDEVLSMVKKGADKNTHIKAGKKAVKAGAELSEYVMPGLGGVKLSKTHALETADALNQINPHFIRFRTFAIRNENKLYKDEEFEKCNDVTTVKEILLLLQNLSGITSAIKSDHILNLFQEVEGRLPEDKKKMTDILENFLSMTPEDQTLLRVGKRIGMLGRVTEENLPSKLADIKKECERLGITEHNADQFIEEAMSRFI